MAGVGVPQGDRIHVELDPTPMLLAHAAHRRRLAATALELDAEALAAPSRCARWSVADVLRHICDVDSWLGLLWAGEQPPFDRFNPLTTPDEFVERGRARPDTEVPGRCVESTAAFLAGIDPHDEERWPTMSVSPLGFVPWWQSAVHVFWDSWLHERDVLLPLGREQPTEADEVLPVLLYGLAVTGTFCSSPVDVELAGAHLRAGDGPPHARPGPAGVRGDAATAAVVDALAGRGELRDALPDVDAVVLDQVGGLARFFRT